MNANKLLALCLTVCLTIILSQPLNAAKKKKVDLNFVLQKVVVEPTSPGGNISVNSEARTFNDDIISVTWKPDPKGFHFELVNKANHSVSIIWDKCAYINENGESHRVMHSEVRFIKKEEAIVPTVVPLQAKVQDVVFPTPYARFGATWQSVGEKIWTLEPLYSVKDIEKKYRKDKKIDLTWRVILALEIKEAIYNYHFFFNASAKIICPYCNNEIAPDEVKCPKCSFKSAVFK